MKACAPLILAALVAAPLYGNAAETPPANVRATFGNTLFTIDADGRSRKIWLRPDGVWTGLSRRGLHLAGKWKVDGQKVCMSQSKPALPGSLCEEWPRNLEVGGPEVDDPSGKSAKLKLVKGRVTH